MSVLFFTKIRIYMFNQQSKVIYNKRTVFGKEKTTIWKY